MTNLPEGVREITDHELRQDANPSFTVWRINLIDATASPVQTFKGYAASVNFSLDGNYLTFIQNYPPGKGKAPGDEKFAAFHQPRVMMGGGSGPESPNLTLADLRTGDILATLEANNFFSWSPYPDRYIYNQIGAAVDGIHPWGIFLGQIGKDPIFLKLETGTDYPSLYYAAQWVDSERFVLNAGCRISLFSLAR